VLGANDGIVSTTSLAMGVTAAGAVPISEEELMAIAEPYLITVLLDVNKTQDVDDRAESRFLHRGRS
jgi:NH3-dependent NAD+ synthetase